MSQARRFLGIYEASRNNTCESRLFQLLDEFFKTDVYTKNGLRSKGISDETYDKESYIYVHTDSLDDRKKLEGFLMENEFKINKNYSPDGSTAEVMVSYKEWHLDE